MSIKKLLLAVSAAVAICSPASAATFTFAGSWFVGDGPVWSSNPTVYSGQDAAALLFGGTASDYAISTIDNNVANINFSAFVDGWGDETFLTTAVSQSYKFDDGAPGYDAPGGTATAYSAFVFDHSCFNRYNNMQDVCAPGEPGQNFAFRVSGVVPEPATWAMMIGGFGLAGATLRRRRAIVAA